MCVPARVVLAAVACASVSCALDVANFATDFFTVRDINDVVIAVQNRVERLGVFRSLAADGRFRVAVPDEDRTSIDDILDAKRQTRVGVLLRGAVPRWLQTDNLHWFNASYHWLIVDDRGNMDLGAWGLRLNSEVFRARPAGGRDRAEVLVEEMVRMNRVDAVEPWPFAEWTAAGGLVSTDWVHFGGDALQDHRTPLRRIHNGPSSVVVQTAVFEEHHTDREVFEHLFEVPPEVALQHLNYLSIATFTISTNTFEQFNFTVKNHEYLVSGELDLPATGYFSGASGAVQRGTADLVSSGLLMSDGRLRHFIFTPTTYNLRNVCLFLADGSLGSVDALLTPFHWLAWSATVAVAAAGLLIHRLFRKAEGEDITWGECLLTCVGTLTGQGFPSAGTWASGRILLLVFEVLFMLIQGYYSSSIVKFLLRPPPPSVHDIQGLLHSSYPVALHNWWLTIREFETAETGIAHQLYEKKIRPPEGLGYMPHDELAKVLVWPLHAVIGAQENVYKSTTQLSEGQACRLHEMDAMPVQHIAPIISRTCPFREAVYSGFLLQRERGILQRVTRKWQQRRAQCSGDGAHGEGDPIGLEPVLPVLGLMALGIVIASLVAVLERTRKRSLDDDRHSASAPGPQKKMLAI